MDTDPTAELIIGCIVGGVGWVLAGLGLWGYLCMKTECEGIRAAFYNLQDEMRSHEPTGVNLRNYLDALEACYEWDREEYQSKGELVDAVKATKKAYYGIVKESNGVIDHATTQKPTGTG